MTLHVPIGRRTLFILLFLLVVVLFCGWIIWQFNEVTTRSGSHNYYYSIDLSYNTTIRNVTLVVPLPEVNNTPVFIPRLTDGTAYGISPDWNLTLVYKNNTPMLSIRAERMVPKYYGYPVAIEPGASILPTTRIPGHEYSVDAPVLMPVTINTMETSRSEINTRLPVGHEPIFSPEGVFTPGSGSPFMSNYLTYDHTVPVYISYTADQPVLLSLRVNVQGVNAVWRGGWRSNSYSDTVALEITNGTQGWIDAEAHLLTDDKIRTIT
ncbi:MAG: hypothetical protein LUQ54_02605 [Methanoregula sp.]|nr:hypothetical protein [Methanoregula sp.]